MYSKQKQNNECLDSLKEALKYINGENNNIMKCELLISIGKMELDLV